MLYDAHNHLQDERLDPWREQILASARAVEIGMVGNGTCENDWQRVSGCSALEVIPSLGLHPRFTAQRSPDWRKKLETHLDSHRCAIGEIGLDRWMTNADIKSQEEIFISQLEIAARRNLPASIHCLKAWGRLN